MKKFFFLMHLFGASIACTTAKTAHLKVIKQGIAGVVQQVSGNQMPMKGVKPAVPQGIAATIFIYEKTSISQVVQVPNQPLYSSIKSHFITTAKSDESGRFLVHLPKGSYSLFVQQGTVYYANSFDTNNNIAVVNVQSNQIATTTIGINTSATY